MLLSLIVLSARLAVLELPNCSIDQVHSAAFSLVSFKQIITEVLKIAMTVYLSHTLIDVKLFAK